jgi:hypothetical protein
MQPPSTPGSSGHPPAAVQRNPFSIFHSCAWRVLVADVAAALSASVSGSAQSTLPGCTDGRCAWRSRSTLLSSASPSIGDIRNAPGCRPIPATVLAVLPADHDDVRSAMSPVSWDQPRRAPLAQIVSLLCPFRQLATHARHMPVRKWRGISRDSARRWVRRCHHAGGQGSLCLYCVKRKWIACSAVELPPMYTVYSVSGSKVDRAFAS